MTELKTLKDFEFQRDISDFPKLGKDESLYPELIDKKELKAEAVKYYLDLKKHQEIDKTTDEALILEGAMRWIKHFFNLTEEDFK